MADHGADPRPSPSHGHNHGPPQRSPSDLMAMRNRQEHHFEETEAALPAVTQHTSFALLNPLTAKAAAASKISDLLSYLGPHNPLPIPVAKTDAVWIMDNMAFKGPKGHWEAEFVACVFAQHPSCSVLDAVRQVADKLDLDDEPDEQAALDTIEERLVPFLMDIQPGRQVKALHGGYIKLTFSPGGRNGISSDVRTLPDAPPGMFVPTTAEVPPGVTGLLQAKTFFTLADGWGVISDVDDTIKVTQTSDPIGILKTTFLEMPRPVKGMPELYAFLQKHLTTTSPFFYLSASPYNLYPFLRDFRDRYYPHGQLVLRDASWMSIPGLLSNLTLGTQEYKVARMQKMHSWLPRKKMICIGDSTQSDPESYGEIYRAFPGWIKLILIRKVVDIASLGIRDKNEPERFENAFRGMPKSAWHVFEDPAECYEFIQDVTED